MVAVLTKRFGLSNVETAQDIVQETLLAALDAWKLNALPDNPRAWLYRVAKNRALDHLRRRRHWQDKIAPGLVQAWSDDSAVQEHLDLLFLDAEIEDSQLRMLFACCHPALAAEGQIALILKTLCGLSVSEIAAAFLTGKDNIEKRLYRTREKIRHERIALEVPPYWRATRSSDWQKPRPCSRCSAFRPRTSAHASTPAGKSYCWKTRIAVIGTNR